MRDFIEGCYILWHHDIAFPLLHECLVKSYPDLHTLPSVEEGREWRENYIEYVNALRASDHVHGTDKRGNIEELRIWLLDRDALWGPPPHLSANGTPVPKRNFEQTVKFEQGSQVPRTSERPWCTIR